LHAAPLHCAFFSKPEHAILSSDARNGESNLLNRLNASFTLNFEPRTFEPSNFSQGFGEMMPATDTTALLALLDEN